ncbi:MAG: rRNA maturation RNase YbeY [Planctomycetaceae bacterium]
MPRYAIDIANEQDRLPVDEVRLRDVIARTLELENVAAAEISLAIVDDATIHELNRRHLAHDYPTDVLSFLLDRVERASGRREPAGDSNSRDEPSAGIAIGDDMDSGRSGDAPEGSRPPLARTTLDYLEGEIVVSADTAARQAGEFGWSPGDELVLYVVHGLLHLTGHDDGAEAKRAGMRSREREILRTWGLSPRYDDGGGERPPEMNGSTGGHT